MKRIALAVLTVATMSTGSSAAIVEFRGSLCLTAVTPACAAEGWVIGDCFPLRYTPPNLGDNGPSTRLSIFSQNLAENYTLGSGSLIGPTFQTVQGTLVGRGGFQFTATMRITSQAPAVLTATTNFVNAAGNIKTFDDTTGCDVGFRASGTRRPP